MIQRTFDTPTGLALDITIVAGEIAVHATETTVTTLRIDGGRDTDDISIDLLPAGTAGHQLVVEQRTKRAWGIFSLGVDLDVDVTVPLGTTVTCDAGSSDVAIDGRIGSLGVRVGSGDLRFDEVDGDVTVKAASGDVKGRHVGGDVTVHGASGDVTVTRVDGALVMRTASGDLLVGEADGSVQVNTMSGDLQIRSLGGPSAELRSVSGDIDVGVPQGRGVYLDLSSLNGDVRSDLESGTTPATEPDLDLVASTVSGDVRVRRAPSRSDA
jgi:DUF4097 and DUF4098 domain-containing protein YvlB